MPIRELSIPNKCMSATSNCSFLYAVWFQVLSSPRAAPKNLSSFCLLSLILQCLLACLHCSLTRWLSAWADASPFCSSSCVRSPANQGCSHQLVPGTVLCDTSSLSHGDKADQRSHDSRGPVNPQTELLGPFTSPLTLTAKCLYHSHCCCCSVRGVPALPITAVGKPISLQSANS